MEKIFLASTNKMFVINTSKDIRSSLPMFKDKEVSTLEEKEDLIKLLHEDNFDLIIMDNTLVTLDDIRNITIINGLVWFIDSNLSTEQVKNNFFIWNSNSEYKKTLLRLGTSNPMIRKSKKTESQRKTATNHEEIKTFKSNSKKTEDIQEPVKKQNAPLNDNISDETINKSFDKHKVEPKQDVSIEKTVQSNGLTLNQKRILQEKSISTNNEELEKKAEDSSAVYIAPPYPTEILPSVQSKMIETKKMKLDLPLHENDREYISKLETYVNEYFNLVTYKEFIKQINKRVLATMEMKDYINMNGSSLYNAIGVWSPIGNIGVTTFVMNFAFFIGQQLRLPISVMEGLRENPIILKELKRISPNKYVSPKNWHSYVNYVNARKKLEEQSKDLVASSVINFKGVFWYPLDTADYMNSDVDDIPYYVSVSNPKDIVIVDLPNGEFRKDTRKTIKHLNELWILLDGSTDMIFSYIEYIKKMQQDNPHLSIYVILQNYFPIVTEKLIRDTFNYPVLAKLPDLNDEVRKNKYEKVSIMDNPYIESLLKDSFNDIGVHVYQDNYRRNQPNQQIENHTITKMLEKVRNIFV